MEHSWVLGPGRARCPRTDKHTGRDSLAQHQLTEGRWGAQGGKRCGGHRGWGAGGRGRASRCPAALLAAFRDQPGVAHVLAGGGHGAVRPAAVVYFVIGAGAWRVWKPGGSPQGPGGHPALPFSSLSPLLSPPWRLLSYETPITEAEWQLCLGQEAGGVGPDLGGGDVAGSWHHRAARGGRWRHRQGLEGGAGL